MSRGIRIATAVLVAAAELGVARRARAYPSAVVFAPTAETLPAGEVSMFAAQIVPVDGGSAVSFVGTELGISDGLQARGTRWLALELGVDVEFQHADSAAPVAPFLNAKLTIVDEGAYRPAVAIGLFQLSPVRAVNAALAFVAATRRLGPAGELTVGLFHSFASRRAAFIGSTPFRDSREGFELGWTSPPLRRFSLGVDVVSGTSQASGANLIVSCDFPWRLHLFAGLSASVDRRSALAPSESLFAGVATDLSLF